MISLATRTSRRQMIYTDVLPRAGGRGVRSPLDACKGATNEGDGDRCIRCEPRSLSRD